MHGFIVIKMENARKLLQLERVQQVISKFKVNIHKIYCLSKCQQRASRILQNTIFKSNQNVPCKHCSSTELYNKNHTT